MCCFIVDQLDDGEPCIMVYSCGGYNQDYLWGVRSRVNEALVGYWWTKCDLGIWCLFGISLCLESEDFTWVVIFIYLTWWSVLDHHIWWPCLTYVMLCCDGFTKLCLSFIHGNIEPSISQFFGELDGEAYRWINYWSVNFLERYNLLLDDGELQRKLKWCFFLLLLWDCPLQLLLWVACVKLNSSLHHGFWGKALCFVVGGFNFLFSLFFFLLLIYLHKGRRKGDSN